MKKWMYLFTLTLFTLTVHGQEDTELYNTTEEEEEVKPKKELTHKQEIGLDLAFNAGNFGGSFASGVKLGFLRSENFIFGPSIRYQHSWYKNQTFTGSYSIYGGGFFAHGRAFNWLFAGAEFEMISTPFKNGYIATQRQWVPTLLIGGGISHGIGPNFRLNAGIMYDAINSTSSPFRQSYFIRKENGALIPVLYRIAFFFSL